MSWRVVVVSSNAKLDYKLDYLVVRTIDEVKRIHLSEIGVLILESTAISLTAYLMYELSKRKVKIIFCDHQRNPYGELVPLHGCHDSSAKIRQQLKWPESVKQQVWTELVGEKIRRQRDHLRRRDLPQYRLLERYIQELQFNDASNREGHAAKVYFNALFGREFSRAGDCPINAALNYGYSLILSAINREISAAGYLNQIGLFHENTYNPFNFGCDIMEPLRPMIDSMVYDMSPAEFELEEKRVLLQILRSEVSYDGKTQSFLYALRLYCTGIFRALQGGDMAEIKWIDYEW